MPIDTWIFDFDGTLCDSFGAFGRIMKSLEQEFGFTSPSPEMARSRTARENLAAAGIDFYKMPFLLRRARKELLAEVPHLKPFPGIPSFLEQLHLAGHDLFILTSNSREAVSTFLKSHQCEGYFRAIHSESNLFGKGHRLRRLLKQYKKSSASALYVGDETRDIEAARSASLRSVAVTWGFNGRELLQGALPDFLAETPEELLALARKNPKALLRAES